MTDSAYIFDLDGTLVDSLDDIAAALNRALAEYGFPMASRDNVRQWVGDGLRTLCQRASGTAHSSRLDDLFSSAQTYYKANAVVHTKLYPNILKMLDLLKSLKRRMAVLSNKPHGLTLDVAQCLKIDHYFVEIRGVERDENRKPSPTVALELAARLNVPPEGIFLVGDSSIDVQTARNAGMNSIAVTWGFRPPEELLAAGAQFLVRDPLEIPQIKKK